MDCPKDSNIYRLNQLATSILPTSPNGSLSSFGTNSTVAAAAAAAASLFNTLQSGNVDPVSMNGGKLNVVPMPVPIAVSTSTTASSTMAFESTTQQCHTNMPTVTSAGDKTTGPLPQFVSNYNWGAAAFLTNYMQHFWHGNNYFLTGSPEWDVYLKEMQVLGEKGRAKCDQQQTVFKECADK